MFRSARREYRQDGGSALSPINKRFDRTGGEGVWKKQYVSREQDFEYVVFKRPPPRVAFGTGLARETLPTSGPQLSSFMRHYTLEGHPGIAPATYHTPVRTAFYNTLNKPHSTAGTGGRSARFVSPHTYQPPSRARSPPAAVKPNCAPFNSTTARGVRLGNDNPAPCDYNTTYKPKQMRFSCCFNGKKTLLCVVEIKCVPYNLDACAVCERLCGAQGDYWHFENRVFLCRKHYERLYTGALAKFHGIKLAEFKSIRDCFFAHLHNSCVASVKLMTQEQIQKKLRKEAYLDLYFPQRRKYV